MTRTAILALVQTCVVVLGFVTLGVVLKILGYPDEPAVTWNWFAVLLREHGLWLLIVPPVWVLVATRVRQSESRFVSDKTVYVGGILLTGVIVVLFFYASISAYVAPIWFTLD